MERSGRPPAIRLARKLTDFGAFEPEPTRSRTPGYDVLRIIAILAVIAIHTLMVYRGVAGAAAPVILIDQMLHFAVPVFFFVSGAVIWGRPFAGGGVAYARFLRGRASRVVLPYLAWSAVYLLLLASRQGWLPVLQASPLLILSGRTWYHLFFVPALLLLYLLTPLASPLAQRWPGWFVLAAYALRLGAASFVAALVRGADGASLWSVALTVTVHLSEMALGAWFAVRIRDVLPNIRRWWPALIAAGGALLLMRLLSALPPDLPRPLTQTVVPLGTALEVLGLAGLCFALTADRAGGSVVRRTAALTYGVYLSHPLTALAWNGAVAALGWEALWRTPWFALVAFACIAAASFAVSALLARRPMTAWLVGL